MEGANTSDALHVSKAGLLSTRPSSGKGALVYSGAKESSPGSTWLLNTASRHVMVYIAVED